MIYNKVLDHGYIGLVEHWGSDEKIIEAARQSTQKGFQGWGDEMQSGDEKLLKYLWTNHHATPFEFAGAIFEVQAPIFVFREWHRHRTQSFSEMSARYAPLPDFAYVPTVDRLVANSRQQNKQAGTVDGAETLTEDGAINYRDHLRGFYEFAEGNYREALRMGVPKELARLVLPVGRYSRMRASANLRNWMAFLTLREAPTAQQEIREYATALHQILKGCFPRTMELFERS